MAEDNPADVLLVRQALQLHGLAYELTIHGDGEQMVRSIDQLDAERHPCPDVVLLDLNLPRKDAATVLRRMRESPMCGRVPVVIVTSSNLASDRETINALGANAYFRKSSDYDEFMQLGALVREVTGGSTTEQTENDGRVVR